MVCGDDMVYGVWGWYVSVGGIGDDVMVCVVCVLVC